MPNQSLQRVAYPANYPEMSGNSAKFNDLLDRWMRAENRVLELSSYADSETAGIDLAAPAQVKLTNLFHEIELEQREILKVFAETPADNPADVLAKLRIWKSMMCPDREDEAYLQPADHLVLSVYNDLAKLDV